MRSPSILSPFQIEVIPGGLSDLRARKPPILARIVTASPARSFCGSFELQNFERLNICISSGENNAMYSNRVIKIGTL